MTTSFMRRVGCAAAFLLAACSNDKPSEAEDTHKAGEPAIVRLDTAGARLAGIVVAPAESTTSIALPVTGTITYDANRVSHVGSRTEGRVVELGVDLGSRVTRGQVLVELESPEVGQIRADEQQAEALLRIARENFQREQRLEQQGISSRKELLEAEAELRRGEAALKSASDRLRVLGAGHGDGGHFDLIAPFAGTVVGRNMSLGQMARPTDTLVTIADLSRVWIELDIFERDLARVRSGLPAAVSVTAYPDRSFPGRIVYVGEVLDPAKRTARARVEIPNADAALKPGMFATASIALPPGGSHVVTVPEDAVQDIEGKPSVFVPGSAPGEFRVVNVDIGERLPDKRVVIRSGIKAGDAVVVAGAFALRSELARAELEAGEH